MSDDTALSWGALGEGFGHDVLLEWIPDALGYADLVRDVGGRPYGTPYGTSPG
ncbi:hypothetical protein NKH77_28385 [Streptomyces sp. M19]